jgi:uncharacterized protein YecE (DUF72 family)
LNPSIVEPTPQIRIGTAGWSYKDWEGIFYPSGMQRKRLHPLEFVAQCFDVVEINTSFYGHLKPELVALWARKVQAVNPKFVFTAKLHRSFTHSSMAGLEPTSAATINPNDEDERLAREGLDKLAATGKFGSLLIQFPASFKNTLLNREYIDTLLRQFIEYPRVIEVRHSSWDDADTIISFAQKNVAFCNIDQPLIGRSLQPTEHVTSSVGYVRLHGRNYDQWFEADKRDDRYNYLYTEDELAGWKDKINRISQKAEVTYVIANNHFEGKAGVNALQLKYMLTKQRVKAPESLLRHYPGLKKIADPLDDQTNPTLSLLA